MKITNNYNLPESVLRAVIFDPYRREGHISVTELIKPPQMRHLEVLHDAEIEEDASDRLWLLLGSAVHIVLERASLTNVLQEERLRLEVNGWTVTGIPDLWHEPHHLKDYKVTSVWSFLLGDKPEWEMQLNLYAALYREHGFPVEDARIEAILRDWQASRVSGDYPPIPFMEHPVRLVPHHEALADLFLLVARHQEAARGIYDPCTEKERWARPETWAVKRVGQKRAKTVAPDEEEAQRRMALLAQDGKRYEIEHRPGRNVRCERYCRAAPFCEQRAKLGIETSQPEAEEEES